MPHEPPEPDPTPMPAPRMSRLAIVAMVLAVVPCCPLTGLLGSLLGLHALRRIRLAGGALGGRRLALAAVIVGAATAVVWAGLGEHVARLQEEAQTEALVAQIESAVRPIDPDDADAAARAEAAWSTTGDGRPSDEERAAFRAAVAERYGRLERVSIVSLTQTASLAAPTAECAFSLHFRDRGMILGAARFEGEVRFPLLVPIFRLTGLSIEDPEAGDLVIGLDLAPAGDGGAAPPDVP
jgi:hypothetical protein